MRVVTILAVSLGVLMVLGSLAVAQIVRASCSTGWQVVSSADNSFAWTEPLPGLRAASWTGSVQLLENYDSGCYVTGIHLDFTGPVSGGTFVLAGNLFVSATIQNPSAFSDYGAVATNAYGALGAWSPTDSHVQPHYGINARGADEFFVQDGLAATIAGVTASFSLPLDLLGQTVYAQMHVGTNLYNQVNSFYLQGSAPPPPPPAPPPPPPPNAPPSADFSWDPSTGDTNTAFTFTATVSDDQDPASSIQVRWDWNGDGTWDTSWSTTHTAQHTFGSPADYTVVLEAIDSGGLTTTASHVVSVAPAQPLTASWDVYVHAHEDDWQLWQSPMTYYDYQNGDNLLFITATAGDGGQGASWWQAREAGQEASVRALAGSGLAEASSSVNICYTAVGQVCHSIWHYTYGDRTTSFFMRLPDGNLNGSGFASTGFHSLPKLRDGRDLTLTALDNSATYVSWADFYLTLQAIVSTYAPYDSTTWLNAPEFDRAMVTGGPNSDCPSCPGHADHLAVADAVYQITVGLNAPWGRAFFIDYPMGWNDTRYPANLDATMYAIKKSFFMAYSDTIKAMTGFDEYLYGWTVQFWENSFHREYVRVI